MEYISEQLAADVEVLESQGRIGWEANLILLPEFCKLKFLTIVGENRDFITEENYKMYLRMCKRASDEQKKRWKKPKIGYIVGEVLEVGNHELAVRKKKEEVIIVDPAIIAAAVALVAGVNPAQPTAAVNGMKIGDVHFPKPADFIAGTGSSSVIEIIDDDDVMDIDTAPVTGSAAV